MLLKRQLFFGKPMLKPRTTAPCTALAFIRGALQPATSMHVRRASRDDHSSHMSGTKHVNSVEATVRKADFCRILMCAIKRGASLPVCTPPAYDRLTDSSLTTACDVWGAGIRDPTSRNAKGSVAILMSNSGSPQHGFCPPRCQVTKLFLQLAPR